MSAIGFVTRAALALAFLSSQASAQTTIYESATMGPSGQTTGPSISQSQWLGVAFTTTAELRITALGGHMIGPEEVFLAVFPAIGTTPPNPPSVSDAVWVAYTTPPVPSDDHRVSTNFVLPAGDWALVVGRVVGAEQSRLAGLNTPIGTPMYLVSGAGYWTPTVSLGPIRLYIEGEPVEGEAFEADCGDGIVQPPEQCDDGNVSNRDGCLNNCRVASCGDGFVSRNEECDDGNAVDKDDCTNDCLVSDDDVFKDDPQNGSGGSCHVGVYRREVLSPLWLLTGLIMLSCRRRKGVFLS